MHMKCMLASGVHANIQWTIVDDMANVGVPAMYTTIL